MTPEKLQKYQNLDPVIRQLKYWHKYFKKANKSRYQNLRN